MHADWIDLRDRESGKVDRSVDAILAGAEEYLNDKEIMFLVVSSLMKLSVVDMTTRHEDIKKFVRKVEAHSDYFIHKTGEGTSPAILEFIRMAKYSKALYNSAELHFDRKMPFLNAYVEEHLAANHPRVFAISKKKSFKEIELINKEDQDCTGEETLAKS